MKIGQTCDINGQEHSKLQSPPVMSHVSSLAPDSKQARHWAKQYRTEISALSSSVLATFAAYPLDSVKTRMQAYKFDHFRNCVYHTYRTEGFQGFWRGASAPLVSIALVRTLSFSIYQKAKYKYSETIGRATGNDEPLVTVNRPGSNPTPATMLCFATAGATAGGIISFVACPFELTKLSAQISVLMANHKSTSLDDPVRRSYEQKGTFQTVRQIVSHHGLRGLYSGFRLHFMRDTIGTAIYFTTYESGKQLLVKFQGSDSPTSPSSVAMAGGMCGLVSWACIYPVDIAKTKFQRNCLIKVKGEPVKIPKITFLGTGNYRGLGVSMARSCLINTIFFSSFELMKKRINSLPDPLLD